MSEHGATLQTFNQELVKLLEDLKQKRNKVHYIIEQEEAKKQDLESKLKKIQFELDQVNTKLQEHKVLRKNYDQTINDTEMGFKKILESSQTLLNLVQHEANKLHIGLEKK